MVSVNNFSIQFDTTSILEDISFDVQAGEIVTLLGQSGCGKTTILRSIAGLQREHGGNICIGDTCVSSKDVYEKNREVGYIFQDYALFPHLNVEENIAFALDKLSKKEKEKRVSQLLEQFDITEHRKKQIHQLSGGQQQRLAIARALAMEPEYMLFDEITSALDPELVGEVLDTLRLLRKEGMTMICVTHEIAFAREVSDRIAFFHKGVIEEIGTPEQVIGNPQQERTKQFLSKVLH